MRIVYVSEVKFPSRLAGSIQVMRMCEAFCQNGHEVILVSSKEKGVTKEDILAYYGVNSLLQFFFLPMFSWLKGGGYFYGFLAGLIAVFKKPDVVFGRHVSGCFFASLFGLKTILELHVPIEQYGRVNTFLFRKSVGKKNLKVVVISQALADEYLAAFPVLKDRLIVAHDAAVVGSESARADFSKRPIQAGYFGHLYPGKGMEIISELASFLPDVDFEIYGGREEDIQFWEDKLADRPNINFHGFIPPAKVRVAMQSCHILLAPYLSEVKTGSRGTDAAKWMSPLKILEYMEVGRVVVASDLAVLREILQHGKNGYLCDPQDIQSWATQIQFIMNHPQLAERVAQQARTDVLENYTWHIRAKKVLAL